MRRNATITETRKIVLSKCQGLSDRGSLLPRLLRQILQPPFLQGAASLARTAGVATLLVAVEITTSPSSVVSPAACCCIFAVFVGPSLDGGPTCDSSAVFLIDSVCPLKKIACIA
ncbi:hypothetical protein X777_09718 [Ooceraea biroi]|uniref:Uncharacterized protein n=1 Tax=Ooceraea biroi TaxID=2015173 RepID=A0A026W8U3_OOCBI|nr:hypothetical protein X777_09718 [Ooceraea biroi]